MLFACCDQSYGMKDRFSLATLVFLSCRRSFSIWTLLVQRCITLTINAIVHWNRSNTGPIWSSAILQRPFFLDSSQAQLQSAQIQQACLATIPLHCMDQVAAPFWTCTVRCVSPQRHSRRFVALDTDVRVALVRAVRIIPTHSFENADPSFTRKRFVQLTFWR